MPYHYRIPLLALGMISLLLGLLAGLLRLGFEIPSPQSALPGLHGPLMIGGFLGTVIGLERAVALGRLWGYTAPLLSGTGTLVMLATGGEREAAVLITLASLVILAVFAVQISRHFTSYMAVMAAGAAAWLAGNLLWLAGGVVDEFVLWWAAFLTLTIAGERLELSRLLGHSTKALALFCAAAAVFMAGVILQFAHPGAGAKVAGAGMILLALWLFRHDIAMITIRQSGLTRYIAVCLLIGYFWLGAGGALALTAAEWLPGPWYDATLHCVFLGFVFSMIFGHAPVIFPAIIGKPMAYSPWFYLHLALLNISLAVRVAGDMAGGGALTAHGGAVNAAAILLFLANTVAGIVRGARAARS